jgi:hypothetical protein
MSNKASNVIQFMATNSDNKDIHKYALSDMPFAELKTMVEQELEQLIKNVLPHDWSTEDAALLEKAMKEILTSV